MTGRMIETAKYFLEGPTKGNMSASMRKAGYSLNYANHRGDDLLKNVEFITGLKQRRAEIDRKEGISIEVITANFAEDRFLCEIANDRAGMIRVDENYAKHVGFFEKDNLQRTEQVKLDAKQREQVEAFARWSIAQRHQEAG